MIGLVVVLAGVALILASAEILYRKKLIKGELQRKYVHIAGGTFAAFWPWLISWRAIQLLGLGLLAGVLLNRYKKFSHFADGIKRKSYGDILSAVAITLCAILTSEPVIYMLAILHLALADGLAAVIGTRASKKWKYRVFGQTKTIMGSMTFWTTSLVIFGAGSLLVCELISFPTYALILIFLPPVLTLIENISIYGLDNITVPLVVVAVLQWAQTV